MFYKPSINEETFPILEVGPGALPFLLSDIWLDIKFDERTRFAQSGNSKPAVGKPIVYYDGKRFPFKDKAFKYVIASHVLEHVSWEDVPLFISEMERVSDAGYIELPRWTWELINDIPTHKLTGDVKDGRLILYKKTCGHDYNFFTKILIEKSRNFREYIEKEKGLYFCKFEWQKKILFEAHENGYPIDGGKSEIISILKKDCENLVFEGSTPGSLIVNELQNKTRNFIDKIINHYKIRFNRFAPEKDRKHIGGSQMPNFLQCPICQNSIGKNLKCEKCGFYFKKMGFEYNPHV